MGETSVPRSIIDAINRDAAAAFEALLQTHPQHRYSDDGSERWLSFAISDGRVNVVKALVSLGADPAAPANPTDSSPDPEGPMKYAAAAGHLEMVRYLLDVGVPVNNTVGGRVRSVPLGMAVRRGGLDMVRLLVERGAAVNAVWADRTVLDDAVSYDETAVAEYLRSAGAKTAAELAAGR